MAYFKICLRPDNQDPSIHIHLAITISAFCALLFIDTQNRSPYIDALKIFRAHFDLFDLVITDMTMPGLTGIALSQELLAIRPDIPIILCAGFSELVDEKQAREIGISFF